MDLSMEKVCQKILESWKIIIGNVTDTI
jgi:hypothetical protein